MISLKRIYKFPD